VGSDDSAEDPGAPAFQESESSPRQTPAVHNLDQPKPATLFVPRFERKRAVESAPSRPQKLAQARRPEIPAAAAKQGSDKPAKRAKVPEPGSAADLLALPHVRQVWSLFWVDRPQADALPMLKQLVVKSPAFLQKLTIPQLKQFLQWPELKGKVGGKKEELRARLEDKIKAL